MIVIVSKTFLMRRPAPLGIVSMKSPTYLRVRAVAATAVFVLSLATATLTPRGGGEWDFKTIYSFKGQPDGSFPMGEDNARGTRA